MGSYALMAIDEGSDNIGIGDCAGCELTDGNDNTIVGYCSLECSVHGSFNCAFGSNSLEALLDSDSNTATGSYSGGQLAIGTNNLFGGSYAGYRITSGDSNVILGAEAGNGVTQKTDPTNQILIGYGVDCVADNTVIIGNDSITDTYLKGTIHGTVYSGAIKNQHEGRPDILLWTGTQSEYEDLVAANGLVEGVFYLVEPE
jgi:hypothetical protein